jgi:hypothetical protein
MEKRLINSLITSLVVLALVACKSTQQIAKKTEKSGNTTLFYIEEIQKSQAHFKTANFSEAHINFTSNGNDMSIPMSIKIKTDTTIFISIKPFMGIEAYKAELEPTNIKIFDKINQRYFNTSYAYLSQQFGIDINFYNLQSLLSNQLFCIGKAEIDADSCTLSKNTNGTINIEYINGNLSQKSSFGDKLNLIQNQITDQSKKQAVKFEYSKFATTNGRYFPMEMKISPSNLSKLSNINLTFEKIEFDTSIRLNSTDYHKYTKAKIEELLKSN